MTLGNNPRPLLLPRSVNYAGAWSLEHALEAIADRSLQGLWQVSPQPLIEPDLRPESAVVLSRYVHIGQRLMKADNGARRNPASLLELT